MADYTPPLAALEALRDLASPNATHSDAMIARASALIVQLKALHRAAATATRISKEATAAARLEMDQSHLGLQNLQYEKRHLEREIEKCRQFASFDQDVPLYALEDFCILAPAEARTPEVLADEHQLMLNRLSFELAERQRLDLKRRELSQAKDELLKEGKIKSTTMDSVKLQIDMLMKTASDIQKKVDELVQPLAEADVIIQTDP
ncbi:Fms-interacting protein-domain-containing protein [Mycena floridula]|nr:Fms-interacting protein-domain-containing protein [Mycena floridula]